MRDRTAQDHGLVLIDVDGRCYDIKAAYIARNPYASNYYLKFILSNNNTTHIGHAAESEDLAPVLDIIRSHLYSNQVAVDLRKFFKHGSIWDKYSHVPLQREGNETTANTPQSISHKQVERKKSDVSANSEEQPYEPIKGWRTDRQRWLIID